jgi:hypothetical protein
MTHTPPVPAASQSPYPLQEPPHAHPELPPVAGWEEGPNHVRTTAAHDALATLADRTRTLARTQPFALAAIVAGVLGLLISGTLRARRS